MAQMCVCVYPLPCPLKYLWSSFIYIFNVETLLVYTSALCVGGLEVGITGYVCVCSRRSWLQGLVTKLCNIGGQPNRDLMTVRVGVKQEEMMFRCVSVTAPKELQPRSCCCSRECFSLCRMEIYGLCCVLFKTITLRSRSETR